MKYTLVLHLLGCGFELRFFKLAFFVGTIEQ